MQFKIKIQLRIETLHNTSYFLSKRLSDLEKLLACSNNAHASKTSQLRFLLPIANRAILNCRKRNHCSRSEQPKTWSCLYLWWQWTGNWILRFYTLSYFQILFLLFEYQTNMDMKTTVVDTFKSVFIARIPLSNMLNCWLWRRELWNILYCLILVYKNANQFSSIF